MAYGNLNKSTKEINALLDKIKDTDQTLDKASQNPVSNAAVTAGLSKKVDEMPGRQLSEENYTTKDKELLASLDKQIGKVIDHGTGDASFALTPNDFHVWGEMASLDLTLAEPLASGISEFMFQFSSGTQPTTLSLPQDVKWIGASDVEASKTYQVSIVNGLAVLGGVS